MAEDLTSGSPERLEERDFLQVGRAKADEGVHQHREEGNERGDRDLGRRTEAEPECEEWSDRDDRCELHEDREREEGSLERSRPRHHRRERERDAGSENESRGRLAQGDPALTREQAGIGRHARGDRGWGG